MPSASKPTTAEPAGLPRRIGAFCYDGLLLLALWMATLLPVVIANAGEAITGWWLPVVLYGEAVAYYLYSWLRSGQTLGMRTWRLQLVSTDGELIKIQPALVRLLVAPLSALFCGLGYLAYYWGDDQQTWHDRASGSYVVVLPKS